MSELGISKELGVPLQVDRCKIIKVPQVVADAWRAAEHGATVALSHVDDSTNGGGGTLSVGVPSAFSGGVCSGGVYWLDARSTTCKGLYIFAREEVLNDGDNEDTDEPASEIVEVRGTVTDSVCLIPRMSGGYKSHWKSKLLQLRGVETAIDNERPGTLSRGGVVGGGEAANSSATHLFRYYSPSDAACTTSSAIAGGSGSSAAVQRARNKRARVAVTMTGDELTRTLFRVFENGPEDGYSLNDIQRRTGQPLAMVKVAVERIAVCKKHKYSVRPEFQMTVPTTANISTAPVAAAPQQQRVSYDNPLPAGAAKLQRMPPIGDVQQDTHQTWRR
eukprot:Lankesteria_metandrocarpae@DN3546_c0_g1_i2.p2